MPSIERFGIYTNFTSTGSNTIHSISPCHPSSASVIINRSIVIQFFNLGMERAFQNQLADIKIKPAAGECLFGTLATEGSVRCRKASQARRGNIYIKFTTGNQIANFAITAPTNFNIRLTCSEVTANVKAFTQSVQITATTDTPLMESKYMNIAVRSAAANDVVKCSWESSRQ